MFMLNKTTTTTTVNPSCIALLACLKSHRLYLMFRSETQKPSGFFSDTRCKTLLNSKASRGRQFSLCRLRIQASSKSLPYMWLNHHKDCSPGSLCSTTQNHNFIFRHQKVTQKSCICLVFLFCDHGKVSIYTICCEQNRSLMHSLTIYFIKKLNASPAESLVKQLH